MAAKPKPLPPISEPPSFEKTRDWVNDIHAECLALMERKNKDYGAAWWFSMPIQVVGEILQRALRARRLAYLELVGEQAEISSEGLRAELVDIINWATFAIILLDEEDKRSL